MADVRVDRPSQLPPPGVPAASGEQRRQRHDPQRQQDGRHPGGREELAVALDEHGRELTALTEEGPDGDLVVRIVDRFDGTTIAVLTPSELRAIAEQTGLPSGLLFQARS